MSHSRNHGKPEDQTQHRARRRDDALSQTPPNFVTKDDLSNFLSIKPYLSERAQTLVDLIAEIERSGGNFGPKNLGRLLGLMAGEHLNLAALSSLAGLAGNEGGKLDPAALMSLLSSMAPPAVPETGPEQTEKE